MQANSAPQRLSAAMTQEDPLFWARDEVRESFLAPHICLHQALLAGGETASGVGDTPSEARARALSETCEVAALKSAAAAQLPRRFLATRDGIAAAPTWHLARQNALLEACERRGISDWWLGLASRTDRVAETWLRQTGLAAWLGQKRAGADLRRTTDLWRVATPRPVMLVIARSIGSTGQSPMLGYGCAPTLIEAAQKALREMLLMEICVMDDYVARAFGTSDPNSGARRQMTDFAARLPELLPLGSDIAPRTSAPMSLFEGDRPVRALIDWLSGPVAITGLPSPSPEHKIAVCQPLGVRPVLMAGPGSPFVGPSKSIDGES